MITIRSLFNYGSEIIKSDLEANVSFTKEPDGTATCLIPFCRDFRTAIINVCKTMTSSEETWE